MGPVAVAAGLFCWPVVLAQGVGLRMGRRCVVSWPGSGRLWWKVVAVSWAGWLPIRPRTAAATGDLSGFGWYGAQWDWCFPWQDHGQECQGCDHQILSLADASHEIGRDPARHLVLKAIHPLPWPSGLRVKLRVPGLWCGVASMFFRGCESLQLGDAGFLFDLGAVGIARCPALHGREDLVLSCLCVVAERTFSPVLPGLPLGELSGASLRGLA